MRIACALSEGFEDSEFRVPYDKFRSAGHEVQVIGTKRGERLVGKQGKQSIEARGRTVTAWKTVQSDLRYAGANVLDTEVCVDNNLVTSRKPDDIDAFVRECLRLLTNGATARAH